MKDDAQLCFSFVETCDLQPREEMRQDGGASAEKKTDEDQHDQRDTLR